MEKLLRTLYSLIHNNRIYGRFKSVALRHKTGRVLYHLVNHRLARKSVLNLLGYTVVNPYGSAWTQFPPPKMKLALDDILVNLGVKKFDVVIDHCCGDGSHYGPMLRNYSKTVIGVDILEKGGSENLDDYIRVSPENRDSYFESIESESIDCVFMFSSSGFYPNSNWEQYVSDFRGREGRYFTKSNYPRIIRKGGYLIIVEWEAYPEKRFGRRDYRYVSANIE